VGRGLVRHSCETLVRQRVYQQHMYQPLLIFDGETDQLLTAALRPGMVHASRGVVAVLKRLDAA
jgi:Transposase DDE domain group 1